MSDLSSLRVADADREQVIDELREHAGAGRLTSEELEERIGEAYARLDARRSRRAARRPAGQLDVGQARAEQAQGAAAPSAAAGGWRLAGRLGAERRHLARQRAQRQLLAGLGDRFHAAAGRARCLAACSGPPRISTWSKRGCRRATNVIWRAGAAATGIEGCRDRERPAAAPPTARSRAAPSAIARRRASRASCRCASASRCCSTTDRFAEEALLANWQEDGLGADGVVTGVGTIDGRPVALMANDPTVKAGSWGRRPSRRSCASRSAR